MKPLSQRMLKDIAIDQLLYAQLDSMREPLYDAIVKSKRPQIYFAFIEMGEKS